MPLPTPPVDLNKPLPSLPLRAMPSDMARLEDPNYRRSQQQGPAPYPRSRRNGMVFEQYDIDALNAALQDEPPHPQIRRKQVGSSGQPGAPKNRELEDHIAAGGLGGAAVHTSFFHHRSEGDGQTSVAHGSPTSGAPRPNGRGQMLHQDEIPACLRTGTDVRTGQAPDGLTMPSTQRDMISSDANSQRIIGPTPAQVTTGPRPPPVSRTSQTTTTSRPIRAIQPTSVPRPIPAPSPPPTSHLPIIFHPHPAPRPQITTESRLAPLKRWVNCVQPNLARKTGDFFQRQRQHLRERLFDATRYANDEVLSGTADETSSRRSNMPNENSLTQTQDSVGFIEKGHLDRHVHFSLEQYVPREYHSHWDRVVHGVRRVAAWRGWQERFERAKRSKRNPDGDEEMEDDKDN